MKTEIVARQQLFFVLVLLGIVLSVSFVAAADGKAQAFHSGGSDAPAYDLLAKNLFSHRGFSHAGQPLAFRPPGYPLLLAGATRCAFHPHYVFGIPSAS